MIGMIDVWVCSLWIFIEGFNWSLMWSMLVYLLLISSY